MLSSFCLAIRELGNIGATYKLNMWKSLKDRQARYFGAKLSRLINVEGKQA